MPHLGLSRNCVRALNHRGQWRSFPLWFDRLTMSGKIEYAQLTLVLSLSKGEWED